MADSDCSRSTGHDVLLIVENRAHGMAKSITSTIRFRTFRLSMTPRRPAIYHNSRPTKIGSNAFRRIRVIFDLLLGEPLRFKSSSHRKGSFPRFLCGVSLPPVAQIELAFTCVGNRFRDCILHFGNLIRGRVLWVFGVQQLEQETEFRIVPYVIRHGSDLVSQFFEFRNRPSRNPGCSLFMHCMDRNSSIVECQNAIGLVAVSEKSATECVARYQRNNGMFRHSCRCVCICRRSRREEDTGRFLTAPVSLALDVNDCDDGTLRFTRFIVIFGDHCSNVGRQSECFFESNLSVADTRETAVLVRYNAEEKG